MALDDTQDYLDTGKQDYLAGITPARQSPSPTVSDIHGYADSSSPREQEIYDRIHAAENPSAGALPESAYYPSAGNVIKGYSPNGMAIATSSNLYPFAIKDARDKALHDAAMQRVARQEKINQYYSAPPETKNVNLQEKLSGEYYNAISNRKNQLQKKYGKDWDLAAQDDPELMRIHNNFVTVAKKEDALVEGAAQMQKDISDPKKYVFPEGIAAMHKALDSTRNLAGPGVDIRPEIEAMTAYGDLGAAVTDISTRTKEDVTDEIAENRRLGTPAEKVLESIKTKFFSPEKEAAFKEELNNKFYGRLPQKAIDNAWTMFNRREVDKTAQAIKRDYVEDGGNGSTRGVTILQPATERGESVATKASGVPSTEVDYQHEGGIALYKPASIQIQGKTAFDPTTGEVETLDGTRLFHTQRIVNMPVATSDVKGKNGEVVIPKGTVIYKKGSKILQESHPEIQVVPVADGIVQGLGAERSQQYYIQADPNMINTVAGEQKPKARAAILDYFNNKAQQSSVKTQAQPTYKKQDLLNKGWSEDLIKKAIAEKKFNVN